MRHPDLPLYFAVISHERPFAVEEMRTKLGVEATWYVDGEDERKAYKKAGAKRISAGPVIGRKAEVLAKNTALEDAWKQGCACVICADDLRRFSLASSRMQSMTAMDAALILHSTMLAMGDVYLAGAATTNNPYMAIALRTSDKLKQKSMPMVSTDAFVLGDFTVVRPCGVYFNDALFVKHDYEYTLRHLRAFGRVCRCNYLLQDFRHKTNAGGANHKRPTCDELDMAYLLKHWPGAVRINTRKSGPTSWGHEILLNWRKLESKEGLPKPRYSRIPPRRFPRIDNE